MVCDSEKQAPGVLSGSRVARIRICFWVVGMGIGLVLAYTGRHFINSDGLVYLEMGDGLRTGKWWGLVNLVYSPLYAVFLGVAEVVLGLTRADELPWLKTVGFLNLVMTMGACDLFVGLVRRERESSMRARTDPGSDDWLAATIYLLCLVCSIAWIKVRLVNPDMLAFFFVLMSMNVILWIRQGSEAYVKYVTLGISLGFGYLTKTYLFAFAPVFLVLAGLAQSSLRKAIPRLLVALVAMLIVSAPLVSALSYQAGKLSFGEAGSVSYVTEVAAQGQPTNLPARLHENPDVFVYDLGGTCTDSWHFDVGHWYLGVTPLVSVNTLVKSVGENLGELAGSSWWLFLSVLLFLGVHWRAGSLKAPGLRPVPLWLMLVLPGVCGIGVFTLVHLEMRYVSPFVFLLISGLLVYPQPDAVGREIGSYVKWSTRLCIVLLGAILLHACADQMLRGMRSSGGRVSFQEAFQEYRAVTTFLQNAGVAKGRSVGVVGSPNIFWARMAEIRVVAHVFDQGKFLEVAPQSRSDALDALAKAGVEALVGKGSEFAKLVGEGWIHVPGTRDYFVTFRGISRGKG